MTAFTTRAVHAGHDAAQHNGSVTTPIYQASTFVRPQAGPVESGWDYSRIANPTRAALEECLAALEGGADAVAVASGMAACVTVIQALCRSGGHVVIPDNVYGGTWDLVHDVYQRWGLAYTAVDMADLDAVAAAIRPQTALVWTETPSNPLLKITDIAAVAGLAHEAGALLVVDGTFASPYLQQPIALGADLVIHSTTKYLGGHSDITGGAVVAATERARRRDQQARRDAGRRGGAAGGLAGAPRHQDASGPDAADLRERPADRRVPRRAPGGAAGALPRTARPSGSPAGRPSRCAAGSVA